MKFSSNGWSAVASKPHRGNWSYNYYNNSRRPKTSKIHLSRTPTGKSQHDKLPSEAETCKIVEFMRHHKPLPAELRSLFCANIKEKNMLISFPSPTETFCVMQLTHVCIRLIASHCWNDIVTQTYWKCSQTKKAKKIAVLIYCRKIKFEQTQKIGQQYFKLCYTIWAKEIIKRIQQKKANYVTCNYSGS